MIRAAINGEVVDKSVQVGQFVTVGTKLGTVKNNTTINASIQLVQEDLDKFDHRANCANEVKGH